jgi:hypothetical protein
MTSVLLFCLFLLDPSIVRAQDSASAAADEYEARLTDVKGEVSVFTAEDPEGGPGAAQMPLQAGDRIKTGSDASAEIALSGEHWIVLRPDSEFTLASLKRADTELGLSLGGMLAAVAKLAAGGFRVRTPAAVAAVRGTEFAVEVTPEQQTQVAVFDEGQVEVRGQIGEPELLQTDQETIISRGRRPLVAYRIKRLSRQRQAMRSLRKRAGVERQSWRALDPEQRRQARQRMIEKLRQSRRERAMRPAKAKSRLREQALREDQKKMQKRKEAIRRRLQGGP